MYGMFGIGVVGEPHDEPVARVRPQVDGVLPAGELGLAAPLRRRRAPGTARRARGSCAAAPCRCCTFQISVVADRRRPRRCGSCPSSVPLISDPVQRRTCRSTVAAVASAARSERARRGTAPTWRRASALPAAASTSKLIGARRLRRRAMTGSMPEVGRASTAGRPSRPASSRTRISARSPGESWT